jgi:hypothetical protein
MLPGSKGVNKLNINHLGALFLRQGQNALGGVHNFVTFTVLARGCKPMMALVSEDLFMIWFAKGFVMRSTDFSITVAQSSR